MNDFVSVFVGVPQSRYAALAILLAIVIVSLAILFGKDKIPISQKFGFVILIFLVSLPGLALSLFQLTCIVTGAGAKNKRWWCSLYAWVLAAIMIFYAVLLVVAAVLSLTNKQTNQPGVKQSDAQKRERFVNMLTYANDSAAAVFAGQKTPTTPSNTTPASLSPVGSPPYPNNQNPMKTIPAQQYAPNPMSPPNNSYPTFGLNGGPAVAGPYPGSERPDLAYAPGATLNGQALPMPVGSPIRETFYNKYKP